MPPHVSLSFYIKVHVHRTGRLLLCRQAGYSFMSIILLCLLYIQAGYSFMPKPAQSMRECVYYAQLAPVSEQVCICYTNILYNKYKICHLLLINFCCQITSGVLHKIQIIKFD